MNYLQEINALKYKIEFIDPCQFYKDCHIQDCINEKVCPIFLHTLVPYYQTYINGGVFSWTEEENKVDVQCPNPDAKVESIVAIDNDSVSFEISSVGGSCCANYKKGDNFSISSCFEKLCPLVYDVIFPWVQYGLKDEIELMCPGCKGKKGLKFKLMELTNESK